MEAAAFVRLFCFGSVLQKEVVAMSLPFHDPTERQERRETTVTLAALGCLLALLRLRRRRRRRTR
jgi:hypothetical protein